MQRLIRTRTCHPPQASTRRRLEICRCRFDAWLNRLFLRLDVGRQDGDDRDQLDIVREHDAQHEQCDSYSFVVDPATWRTLDLGTLPNPLRGIVNVGQKP